MKLFARLVLAGACALLAGARPAGADLIPTALRPADEAPCAGAAEVADRLRALGLGEAEVAGRLPLLDPSDASALAANPEQAQVAGHGLLGLGSSATTTSLIIVGSVLLLALILNAIFHFL